MPNPQILNVLGEQVALEKTMFSPAEKFLVSFDEKYKFPGMTDAQASAMKKVFVKLFSGSSPFASGQKRAPPPCSSNEKKLLIETFLHRFNSLRDELIAERKTQSDSLRFRQILDHIQRLKDYIDFLEETESCQQLDEDIIGEAFGDLTDDQIYELLRQFVFFVLQGQHPLEPYKGRDPNPRGFVARLKGNPLPNFTAFLEEYKDKKYPIPLPIAKVLDVTGLDLKTLQEQINAACAKRMQGIIKTIEDVIEPDNPFWQGLDKNNVEQVIQKLLDTMDEMQSEIKELQEQANQAQGGLIDIHSEKDALKEEAETLRARIAILEKEIASLKPTAGKTNTSALEAALKQAQAELADYKEKLQNCEEARAEKEESEAALLAKLEEIEEELEAKNAEIATFEAQKTELRDLKGKNQLLTEQLEKSLAKLKECEGLAAKISSLEGQLKRTQGELTELRAHEGELTAEIDKHVQEKARLQEQLDKLLVIQEAFKGLEASIQGLLNGLNQDKKTVLTYLSDVQTKRAEIKPESDEIMQQIIALRKELEATEGVPPNMATMVGQILRQVQDEASKLEAEKKELERLIAEQEEGIQNAVKAMEKSNELLSLIRAGREDMSSKGLTFETDKQYLEAAVKAVEGEKQLVQQQKELEAAKEELSAKVTSLTADMEALQTRHAAEIEALRNELESSKDALAKEKGTTADLSGKLASTEAERSRLASKVESYESQVVGLDGTLEAERAEAAQRIQELEQTKMRECEERLANLRQEEEQKRNALITAQDTEKASLNKQIAELSGQVSSLEAEQARIQAAIEQETSKLAAKEAELAEAKAAAEAQQETHQNELDALEQRLLQDCEERLAALRKEEEEKRNQLVGTQGDEKGALQGQINELLSKISAVEGERDSLNASLQSHVKKLEEKQAELNAQKAESEANLKEMEERKMRDCEEKIAALKLEEEGKRKALETAQGNEKTGLNKRIAELTEQLKLAQGEKSALETSIALEQQKVSEKQSELDRIKVQAKEKLAAMQAQLTAAEGKATAAAGQTASLQSRFNDQEEELTGLRGQVISDTEEKAKLYEIIATLAAWITSKDTENPPPLDTKLDTKYGLHRIIDAVLSSIPTSRERSDSDMIPASMSRCYLVFFMTYVYARHFPMVADGDSNTQSQISSFLKGIMTELYKKLDAGIPGKLEAVGSGGIPIQLKSKYMMTILITLLKQMELIHESGKKGADFLKFSLFDTDQLKTLHTLHSIVSDKLKLQGREGFLRTFNLYVGRRTGNTDDDIANLYLRFVTETATQREFPVVMYIAPGAKEIPKFTFPSEAEFSQFLSSPTQKVTASPKVGAPLDTQLPKLPVFSFNILFYLFLLFVKDYLSSVEGELSTSGCPLPKILKHP